MCGVFFALILLQRYLNEHFYVVERNFLAETLLSTSLNCRHLLNIECKMADKVI
jgi:hypothetical protein